MKPPENPQSHHLDECRDLLSSLSHSIPSARSFVGRWAVVSATLGRLRSAADEIAALPPNDLSDDLLRSLSRTLALALSISGQCRAADPPAGRLQTQSDLAAAAASLENHAADAAFLLRSGALLGRLPSPPPSSRREALRAEARPLVTRLQIGTVASRIPALDSLISLLRRDDETALVVAAEGVVPALLRLLDCASPSHPEAREKSVTAIARLSSFETCRHLLAGEAAASLVGHLSRALAEPDGVGSTKEKACAALQALALRKDTALTVGSGGTISILLETCRFGSPSAQAAAAGVLKNLAAVPELREKLIGENAVPVLVRVLQSGTVLARENSAACLSDLTAGEDDQSVKVAIFRQGVLDGIRNFWEAPSAESRDLEPAIRLLRHLSSSAALSEVVLSSGFLPRIILALDSSSAGARTEATRAIAELSLICTEKEGGLECAVPKIVGMLEAKGGEEKEAAVAALAALMSFSICRRLMRKEEKGILNLFTVLDSSACNAERKNIVAVLLAVAQSRRCRKLMVASGASGLLPWLERTEVEGAKKLYELLSKGRLLGVFPRS